jgi:hypothetical protein
MDQAAPNHQLQKNTLGQIKKLHIKKFGTPVNFPRTKMSMSRATLCG